MVTYPFPERGSVASIESFVEALSERELDVLRLAAEGMSNPEIGKVLNLTAGTVKTHMHHIIGKLGVRGRVQAITAAKDKGLLG